MRSTILRLHLAVVRVLPSIFVQILMHLISAGTYENFALIVQVVPLGVVSNAAAAAAAWVAVSTIENPRQEEGIGVCEFIQVVRLRPTVLCRGLFLFLLTGCGAATAFAVSLLPALPPVPNTLLPSFLLVGRRRLGARARPRGRRPTAHCTALAALD